MGKDYRKSPIAYHEIIPTSSPRAVNHHSLDMIVQPAINILFSILSTRISWEAFLDYLLKSCSLISLNSLLYDSGSWAGFLDVNFEEEVHSLTYISYSPFLTNVSQSSALLLCWCLIQSLQRNECDDMEFLLLASTYAEVDVMVLSKVVGRDKGTLNPKIILIEMCHFFSSSSNRR